MVVDNQKLGSIQKQPQTNYSKTERVSYYLVHILKNIKRVPNCLGDGILPWWLEYLLSHLVLACTSVSTRPTH